MALRKKIPAEEFLRRVNGFNGIANDSNIEDRAVQEPSQDFERVKEKVREIYASINGMKIALLLDSNFDVIRRVGAREAVKAISFLKRKIFVVILDGIVTNSLVRVCEEQGVEYLAAANFGNVGETKIKLISL